MSPCNCYSFDEDKQLHHVGRLPPKDQEHRLVVYSPVIYAQDVNAIAKLLPRWKCKCLDRTNLCRRTGSARESWPRTAVYSFFISYYPLYLIPFNTRQNKNSCGDNTLLLRGVIIVWKIQHGPENSDTSSCPPVKLVTVVTKSTSRNDYTYV